MKNNRFDKQLKKGLQDQAALFERVSDTDDGFETVMRRLQAEKKEETKMKRFNM